MKSRIVPFPSLLKSCHGDPDRRETLVVFVEGPTINSFGGRWVTRQLGPRRTGGSALSAGRRAKRTHEGRIPYRGRREELRKGGVVLKGGDRKEYKTLQGKGVG